MCIKHNIRVTLLGNRCGCESFLSMFRCRVLRLIIHVCRIIDLQVISSLSLPIYLLTDGAKMEGSSGSPGPTGTTTYQIKDVQLTELT